MSRQNQRTIKSPNPADKHAGSRVRMRRLMLGMSQSTLASAIGLTFQQVQKYEKGTNRMGASRLQQIAHVLQVPVSFFFEGMPVISRSENFNEVQPTALYTNFLATSEGLSLAEAFMRIKHPKVRRCLVDLVEQLNPTDD